MVDYLKELSSIIRTGKDIQKAKELFESLIEDKETINDMIKQYFKKTLLDPYRYPQESLKNNLVLTSFQNSSFSLSISHHSKGFSEDVTTHVSYSLITPINTEVKVNRFKVLDNWDYTIFDPTLKISYLDTIILKTGEILEIDPFSGIHHHFDFNNDTLFLKINGEPLLPFEWHFDIETKLAWQILSTKASETNAIHLCKASQILKDESLIEPLEKLSKHSSHFLRWAAVQAIATIDGEKGIMWFR